MLHLSHKCKCACSSISFSFRFMNLKTLQFTQTLAPPSRSRTNKSLCIKTSSWQKVSTVMSSRPDTPELCLYTPSEQLTNTCIIWSNLSLVWTRAHFFKHIFWAFWLLLTEQLKSDRKQVEIERGSDMQQRAPGGESNLGPLQRGQSLCTWDARSTNWAKWRPQEGCPSDYSNITAT